MENLLNRFRRMGLLFVVGIIVIVGVALGIVYMQQGARQRELGEQINKLSLTLLKPLPGAEELQIEYDKINSFLSPLTREGDLDIFRYIDIIVGIAEESGIDVDPDSDKFNIPAQNLVTEEKVGEGDYQVLSFNNIRVQGDYDSVMAFISNLESGDTLKTMALKRADTSQVELTRTLVEGVRGVEFRKVQSAVIAMMVDNALAEIPDPINYAGGTATNLMGDNPDTATTVEGFPDITMAVADKGYTGAGSARNGYVLYQHSTIDPDNTTIYYVVSYLFMLGTDEYIDVLRTEYYYTCEADGIVRQFDGPDVTTAMEYPLSEETKLETIATLNIDIYTKSGGDSS